MEVKSSSEKLRELIESYVRKVDISFVVDDLWERIGTKTKEKGFGEKDVERIIMGAMVISPQLNAKSLPLIEGRAF